MKSGGVDIRVFGVCGCPVKRTSAEAVNLDHMRPNTFVKSLEVVFVNETILENA